MDTKPKITAVRFGAKVHVHATLTVPTLGYKLTLKPSAAHPTHLDLTLTPPPRGQAEGQIVSHPEADEDIFVPAQEKEVTVNYDGKAIHVTIKSVTT